MDAAGEMVPAVEKGGGIVAGLGEVDDEDDEDDEDWDDWRFRGR